MEIIHLVLEFIGFCSVALAGLLIVAVLAGRAVLIAIGTGSGGSSGDKPPGDAP